MLRFGFLLFLRSMNMPEKQPKNTQKQGKTRTFPVLLWLLLPLGIFLFVFGEYDDSPGGMLIGVILVAYFLYRGWRWMLAQKRERQDGSQ